MSKTSGRFTGLQVVARLRSIDEDDSGGESETEQGDVLDWQLCSSDEMSDDEETEQFDDTQPIVHLGDLQTTDTNVETHSATQRRSSRPPNPPIGGDPGQLWGPKLV